MKILCQKIKKIGGDAVKILAWYRPDADKKSIQHTLALYKNMLNLNIPDLFKDTDDDTVTIDKVFQNITDIYDKKTLIIIFSTFKLLEGATSEEDIQSYLRVLRHIMMPINRRIQTWMAERMSF